MVLVMMAVAFVADANDPVKELVLKFLLSYGGIAAGVSFLVEGLKAMFKTALNGRENACVIALSYLLGAAAKGLLPEVYGPKTVTAWGLHLLILTFVAVGAATFHDKFLSVLTSFLQKKPPVSGGGDAGPAAPDGGKS